MTLNEKQLLKTWGIVALVCAIVLALMLPLVLSYPVYPAWQKEVHSYQQVQKAMNGTDVPMLPAEDILIGTNQEFLVQLDGRSLGANPTGYVVFQDLRLNGAFIRFVFEIGERGFSDMPSAGEYRGVAICGDSSAPWYAVGFRLNGKSCYLEASCTTSSPDAAMEEAIRAQLTDFAHKIIDYALDA